MKKILLSLSLFALVFLTGCELADSLTSYPVNVPISVQFSASGTNNTVYEVAGFCVDDAEEYQEYADDIQEVSLVDMAFRTISYSPTSLAGDVTVILQDANGTVLFTQTIENAVAADYVETPYTLSLTDADLETVNTYLEEQLASGSNLCLTAILSIDITDGGTTNSIAGAVDIVFEAVAEL